MAGPDFFIVGAPKAGTTALNDYLQGHPQIFIPDRKELHYFGSDLTLKKRARRDLDWYLAHFARHAGEKRIGEASVYYLCSTRAAAEIKAFCPAARIIIMLRNPVDMIYSLHSQLLYSGNESIADLHAALAAEPQRRAGRSIPRTTRVVESLFYRQMARYGNHVQRYLDQFSSERIHIIVFDDFKSDTAGVFRNVLRFLDVDDSFAPDLAVVNPNKVLRSARLHRFLLSPPRLGKGLARALVPRALRQAAGDRLRQWNTVYRPRPALAPELRRQLQHEFAAEIERLGKLIGRDLSAWLAPAPTASTEVPPG